MKKRAAWKENPDSWKYILLYRFLPLPIGMALILLLVFLPHILDSITDHDTPQMSSPSTRVTYDELVRQGSYNLVRQVFLTWEVEYVGGDGVPVVRTGALDEGEAARLKTPGDVQAAFETILQQYEWHAPENPYGDLEQLMQALLHDPQRTMVAAIRFGGGSQYAMEAWGETRTCVDGVEAYIYEENEVVLLLRDGDGVRRVYMCGETGLTDALRIFAMTYTEDA